MSSHHILRLSILLRLRRQAISINKTFRRLGISWIVSERALRLMSGERRMKKIKGV